MFNYYMRIKFFVVTYRNQEYLQKCLESILKCIDNATNVNPSIHVINNHTEFATGLGYEEAKKIQVIHNQGRPDFSTGHLARSWNQAILHGFKSPIAPDCDALVLCQNDSVIVPDFLEKMMELIKYYDYIQCGVGDEVQIMTINSVKAVGLYDERFCNIGNHENDYFLRARLILGDRASITDPNHGRVHNQTNVVLLEHPHQCGAERRDIYHVDSVQYHSVSEKVYYHKWKSHSWMNPPQEIPCMYMFYPYFERLLPELDKKYFVY